MLKRVFGLVALLGTLLAALHAGLGEVILLETPSPEAGAADVLLLETAGPENGGYSGGATLRPGERVKESGNYAIEFNDARLRTDETLFQGCRIGYFPSDKNGIDTVLYEYPMGTHMPVTVNYTFTNMAKEETELLKRVQCQIVYDDKYIFDCTPMQVNPNQATSSGGTGFASLVGVPVEPLVSVRLRCLVALPIPVRDSDRPLVAVLTLDGADVYEVNLRDRDAVVIQ